MAVTLNTASLPYSPASGTGGQVLISNGITTSSWASPNTNFTSTNGTAVMTMPYGEDKVVVAEKAALEVKGKMILNGLDMEERLNTIETVLQIPTRDVTMEAKYPKLAELYKQYMYELEKYKTFERVKGTE